MKMKVESSPLALYLRDFYSRRSLEQAAPAPSPRGVSEKLGASRGLEDGGGGIAIPVGLARGMRPEQAGRGPFLRGEEPGQQLDLLA